MIVTLLLLATPLLADDPVGQIASATGKVTLPQAQAYQEVLRAFLGTLTEADFRVEAKDLTVVPLTGDADERFRTWILSLAPPAVGRKRNHSSVMIKPGYFTLASIEGPTAIMRPPAHPEPLVDLANWNYAGNPYFNSRPLRLRAAVLVVLDMLMADGLLDAADEKERLNQDKLGSLIVRFAYVEPGIRDVLPAEAQTAYLTGLKKLIRRALDQGPDQLPIRSPGIYTRMTPGLVLAARVLNDPLISKETDAYVRRIYTEPRFFRDTGYFPHGGTLDSFQGISAYYAIWTALAGNDPARQAMAKCNALRAHLILPEPDGALVGPSHMASLTSADPAYEQWDSPMRAWAAAMLSDDGAALAKMPDEAEIQEGTSRAVAEVNTQLHELSWAPGGTEPAPWKLEAGGMLTNNAYQYYRAGFYAHRLALQKSQADTWPALARENFIHTFHGEFLVEKTSNHVAIVHTGPIGDPARPQALGFGGGALSAYWTPTTGSVILGRAVGAWSPRSKTMLDEWRSLPAHAVIGLTAQGKVCTSAHIITPEAAVETSGASYVVTARGKIPQSRLPAETLLTGTLDYSRKFQSTSTGLQITTTVTGDGQDSLAELYEVLPIFVREAGRQPKGGALLEFKINGNWVPATDTPVMNVTSARVTRFTGQVEITFDRPRRVKLAAAEWADTYQSRATCRNILIDLLESGDQPKALKGPSTISYNIAPGSR